MPARWPLAATLEPVALALALLLCIVVNAFFVLAEFAILRVRPSRVAELVARRARGSDTLRIIQHNLDEHLGVCQIGITLASVALGVVSQRVAELLAGSGEHALGRYLGAIAVTYLVITGSHVVLGEMVPKAVAIRLADDIALRCAVTLRVFRSAFFPLLWLFRAVALGVVRVARLPRGTDEERHTEEELRIILEHFQERGHISFRRLLFMENVFDFGLLRVKDAMRSRDADVGALRLDAPWSDNVDAVRRGRSARYPVVPRAGERPIGFVHVKDLALRGGREVPDLAALARPLVVVPGDASLESLLGEMQRERRHAALVCDARGEWTGFITLEDVLEEIVGTIRDEFDDAAPARLSDALTEGRIQLDVEADSLPFAVQLALARVPRDELPFPAEWIALAVEERERTAGTYMGDGIAIPHARLADLKEPFVMIVRSVHGIPCAGTNERARLLFVLVTPATEARVHQQLLQSVAMLVLHENPHVLERLRTGARAADLLEVVRAGEMTSVTSRTSAATNHARDPEREAERGPLP